MAERRKRIGSGKLLWTEDQFLDKNEHPIGEIVSG